MQKRTGQSFFAISDTHFGHSAIIRHANRPFDSVEEMDESLITSWNSVVKPTDVVFFLGDFSLRNPALYADRLNGEIHLILGNHDERKRLEKTGRFASIQNFLEVALFFGDEKEEFVLCHYPLVTWNKARYGVKHYYGHTHSNRDDIPGKRESVCVESIDYTPKKIF